MLPKTAGHASAFLAYFAVAIALLAAFLLVYLNVTPVQRDRPDPPKQYGIGNQSFGRAHRLCHAGCQRHCALATRWSISRPGVRLPVSSRY